MGRIGVSYEDERKSPTVDNIRHLINFIHKKLFPTELK